MKNVDDADDRRTGLAVGDQAWLTEDMPHRGLRRGQLGVVCSLWSFGEVPQYEVEFDPPAADADWQDAPQDAPSAGAGRPSVEGRTKVRAVLPARHLRRAAPAADAGPAEPTAPRAPLPPAFPGEFN